MHDILLFAYLYYYIVMTHTSTQSMLCVYSFTQSLSRIQTYIHLSAYFHSFTQYLFTHGIVFIHSFIHPRSLATFIYSLTHVFTHLLTHSVLFIELFIAHTYIPIQNRPDKALQFPTSAPRAVHIPNLTILNQTNHNPHRAQFAGCLFRQRRGGKVTHNADNDHYKESHTQTEIKSLRVKAYSLHLIDYC